MISQSLSNGSLKIQTEKDLGAPKDSDTFKYTKIHESTAQVLETLSSQINGSGPKRVQWKDIIDVAVTKVTKSDLEKIRQKKLTASDRFEEMYQSFKLKNPSGSREEFLDQLMRNINTTHFETETSR